MQTDPEPVCSALVHSDSPRSLDAAHPTIDRLAPQPYIMSSKNAKDQRRPDLIIPYAPSQNESASETDIAGTLSTALPMAAMFTRNKMMGWAAVIFAVQSWLNETPGSSSFDKGKQPAIFSLGMAFMSLGITYMPMFMPVPGQQRVDASGTGPAGPVEVK